MRSWVVVYLFTSNVFPKEPKLIGFQIIDIKVFNVGFYLVLKLWRLIWKTNLKYYLFILPFYKVA